MSFAGAKRQLSPRLQATNFAGTVPFDGARRIARSCTWKRWVSLVAQAMSVAINGAFGAAESATYREPLQGIHRPARRWRRETICGSPDASRSTSVLHES